MCPRGSPRPTRCAPGLEGERLRQPAVVGALAVDVVSRSAEGESARSPLLASPVITCATFSSLMFLGTGSMTKPRAEREKDIGIAGTASWREGAAGL